VTGETSAAGSIISQSVQYPERVPRDISNKVTLA
jgi:hypothetical protein